MTTKLKVINFVLFQIGWFACVISAAHQLPWLGVLLALVVIVWHVCIAINKKAEIRLLFMAIIIGGIFDQLMLTTRLISYQSHGWGTHSWSASLVPVWILGLWLGFATTLNMSLRWMRDKWLIAIFLGFMGGPLAYMGAARLGAVTLNQNPQTLIALAIGWGLLTPLLLKASLHFDGFKP